MKNLAILTVFAALSQPVFGVTVFTDRTAWELAVSATIVTETFDADIAEGPDLIAFAGGIQSQGINLIDGLGDNAVSGGDWSGNVRNSGSGNPGYTSITWTLPEATRAFAGDFLSIASSRSLEIVADWDGIGEQGFDLRANVGSSGFFGIIGTSTFSEIRFDINEGTASIVGNDVFGVDNASYAIPEPSVIGLSVFSAFLISIFRRRRQ